MTPLFSVVIPLYNKADTIERAIRSVQGQTCRDFELIVVNDGSTDNSLAVVQKLSGEFPIRIVDKPNGGVSSARNAGAAIAEGRFIALLDGDDVWFPMHLERMARLIARHPAIKFFGGGYEREAGEYIHYTIPWPWSRVMDVFSAFRYGQPIHTSSIVIERDLWMRCGGFDERFSFYEDYEFFFRLGQFTKCCISTAVSERYTEDAGERLTKRCVEDVRMRYPHLAWLNEKMELGEVTAAMLNYARTIGRLRLAFSLCGGDAEEFQKWELAFPQIMKCRVQCTSRTWAWLYLAYFKIRVHLILWRCRK